MKQEQLHAHYHYMMIHWPQHQCVCVCVCFCLVLLQHMSELCVCGWGHSLALLHTINNSQAKMAITGPCTIKLNIWWGTKTVPGTDLPLSLSLPQYTHTHTHKCSLSTVYCHNILGPRSLIPQTLSWHAKAVYSAKRASRNSFVPSEILSATIMHCGGAADHRRPRFCLCK